jgi:hypothetical protein
LLLWATNTVLLVRWRQSRNPMVNTRRCDYPIARTFRYAH